MPKESGRKELKEFERINFIDLLTNVHPHLKDSSTLPVVQSILLSLKPNIKKSRNKKYGSPDADGYFRGSLIKRHTLGDPEGYSTVYQFFEEYLHNPKDGISSDFTKEILEKLSHKPVEIDFRAKFKDDNMTMPAIINKIVELGFTSKSGNSSNEFINTHNHMQIHIQSIPIGTKAYPRTCHHISFYEFGEHMLTLDIADLPNEKKYNSELRNSWSAGLFELLAMSEAQFFGNSIEVNISRQLHNYKNWKDKRMPLQPTKTQAVGNGLRELSSILFWPRQTTDGLIDIDFIQHQIENGLTFGFDFIGFDINYDPKADFDLMSLRDSSLISEFLLYFTYDPFLFMCLGYYSGLFAYTLIGDYILGVDAFFDVLNYMAQEIGGTINPGIAKASQFYKKNVLLGDEKDLRKTGIFMLTRAINRYIKEKKLGFTLIPESINEVVQLVNPMHTFRNKEYLLL